MSRFNMIFIRTVIIGLIGLTLPAKPLRAHSEHYENTSEEQLNEASEAPHEMEADMEEQPSEAPQEMHQDMPQENEEQPETSTSQTSEASTKTLSATSSAQFNFIPQPAELVLLWLVANPFLLSLVKNRIYSKDLK